MRSAAVHCEASVTTGDRYDASGLPEAQFEPGSNGQVLKNRLGIISQQDMDNTEARALEKTMDALVRTYSQAHRFTAADLCEWHRAWLATSTNGPVGTGR
jgi:cell filamentation protein